MEAIREAKIKNASNRLRKLKKPPEEFKISEDHEEKLTELFRLFEVDVEHGIGEGRISSKHIKLILRSMYMEPSPEELKELIKEINPENPSYISLPDLGRIIQIKMKDKSSKIELERAFQLMDKEEKGFISIDDLRRVAKDIGEVISEEEMQEMIDEADSSNTGHVSKEDFLNFMNKVQDNGV
ncbi:unnamed protein product [Nezara viridula]|uniref:EF-hand domain-containing protein n=1 Tax=Nezara viridula TaxID=85310 RepID=A0A9P0MQU3_NEZVI|nr:unnamed protein product [Nezara viridula]